ncbi:MAG: hypothetical protein R3C61_23120 [Bacteroidia bacterium]
MKKFKKIGLIILGIALLGGLTYSGFAVFGNYSSGTRVGKIVKFSKKGYVFKTYEGQLNAGGFDTNEGGDISPNVWEFSVYRGDDEIREAIDDAMDKGKEVKLYYKEKFYQFDWRGDTKYFIYMVESVDKN